MPETAVTMNKNNWDMTEANFSTLRILAHMTLPIPTGDILKSEIKMIKVLRHFLHENEIKMIKVLRHSS